MHSRPPGVPILLASCAALLLASCATRATHAAPPADPYRAPPPASDGSASASASAGRTPAWAAPELQRLVAVQDGLSGENLGWDELLDALAEADAVFLGEQHTDGTTHRVELAVYEALLARRSGHVVLAMEMFERDAQPALDDYLAGRTDEATFLAAARPWGHYATAYRPLIEHAKACGAPVVASNFPRPLRTRMAKEGADVLPSLQAAGSREVPAKLLPATDEYWRRVDNAVRGHKEMMGGGDDSPQARLVSTQSLWDNSMGEACARALDEHPGSLVLHVNGGFHSEYWDGTVRQLRLRKPDARVLTVAIAPVDDPASADTGGLPGADYVVFAQAVSEDLERGVGAVIVPSRIHYHLHLPPQAAAGARVPLLLWLPDDGLSAEDGLELWKRRLGDECAIAVIEAPTVELQSDLAPGGRWFASDDFTQDADAVRLAVERVWALLLQQQPIDPSRVCLAGEGAGATAVAAVALLTGGMDARCVALAPRGYARIRDISLPLPELRGNDPRPDVSLAVFVDADGAEGGGDDAAWWRQELAEYAGVGLPGELVTANADPWQVQQQAEGELRRALGLSPGAPRVTADGGAASAAAGGAAAGAANASAGGAGAGDASPGGRRYVLVEDGSARTRQWARLFALRESERDGRPVAVLDAPPADVSAQRVPLAIAAADFAAEGRLPQCPGDFGGTTLVVLPAGTTPAETAAWQALQAADPLNKRSRFHRLRVATTEPGSLAAVLAELQAAHRTNVLIVPAVFHADAETMLALQRSVRDVADDFTLHWSPGLGKQLAPGD